MEELLEELNQKCNGGVDLICNPHLTHGFSVKRYLTHHGISLIDNEKLPAEIIANAIERDRLYICKVIYQKAIVIGAYGYTARNALERMLELVDLISKE